MSICVPLLLGLLFKNVHGSNHDTMSSTYFRDIAYRHLYQWAWTFNTYIHTCIHTYIHTYIHIFHGSTSVSHRQ